MRTFYRELIAAALVMGCSLPLSATVTKPSITPTPADGDVAVKGKGEKPAANVTVSIYVCSATAKPSTPADCSSGSGRVALTDPNPYVATAADGAFTANLTDGVVSGSWIWVTQVVSAGTDKGTTESPAVQVAAKGGGQTPTCADCWASIGVGANLEPRSYSDYSNTGNLLQTTHLGNATPQYLLGVSYSLPWRDFLWKAESCSTVYSNGKPSPSTPPNSMQAAYCYPWKAFVNVKFSSGGSQTFNGFTMGVAHSLMSKLDLMAGASFSPFNEVTPGFRNVAVQTVTAQQAAKNPNYSQFSTAAMQNNWRDAFDGFPTTLVSPSGVQGAPIYAGSPLSVDYHLGGFIGINVPVSFAKLLGVSAPKD